MRAVLKVILAAVPLLVIWQPAYSGIPSGLLPATLATPKSQTATTLGEAAPVVNSHVETSTTITIADLTTRLEMAAASQRLAADARGLNLIVSIALPVTLMGMRKFGKDVSLDAYITVSAVGGLLIFLVQYTAICYDHMTADALEGKLKYQDLYGGH